MSEPRPPRPRTAGPGRTLVVFYGIMTIAALARSLFEIVAHFETAPLAYVLSLIAGVIYLVALVGLVVPGRIAFRIAATAMTIELLGVLVVGTLSVADLSLFPFAGDRSTVWAYYGLEYLLIPLVLPVLGLLFLRSQRRTFARSTA